MCTKQCLRWSALTSVGANAIITGHSGRLLPIRSNVDKKKDSRFGSCSRLALNSYSGPRLASFPGHMMFTDQWEFNTDVMNLLPGTSPILTFSFYTSSQ